MGSTQTRRSSRGKSRADKEDMIYVKTSEPHRISGGPVSGYDRGLREDGKGYKKSKAKRNRGYWRKKRGKNKKKKQKKQKQQWESDWEKTGSHFDKQRKKSKSKKKK